MTVKHAFADESARGGYLVCAVVLAPRDQPVARQALRGLCKAGQRRIHMKSEGDRRRREILSVICALDVEARVYQTELRSKSQRMARDECFRTAIPDLASLGVGRLVVESCDQDQQDRQVIREMVEKAQKIDSFMYEHTRPGTEPLLWLPDIVGWAFGKGGHWRTRTQGVIGAVKTTGI